MSEIFGQRDASMLAVNMMTSFPTTVDATQALLGTCAIVNWHNMHKADGGGGGGKAKTAWFRMPHDRYANG